MALEGLRQADGADQDSGDHHEGARDHDDGAEEEVGQLRRHSAQGLEGGALPESRRGAHSRPEPLA